MKGTTALMLAAVAGALATQPVWACGACLEDKVAATYDHAVVQRAAAESRSVVFCEIEGGAVDPERIRKAARQVKGLDAASLRFSGAPAALSFVLGEGGHTPESAAASLQGAAPAGTRLKVIKVMSGGAADAPRGAAPGS